MNWKNLVKNKWLWLGLGLLVVLALGTWWYVKSEGKVEVQGSTQLASALSQTGVTSTDSPNDAVEPVAETSDTTPPQTPEATAANPNTPASADAAPKSFAIKEHLVSFGYEKASGRTIDMIVLHSSYNTSGNPYDIDKVFAIWKSYGVSPHYAIARDGTVYRLVEDQNIAYHAGVSEYKGRKNLNDVSIGIEMLNTESDQYTKAQYQAVRDLIAYLKSKHPIKYVVGHDDIAPGRKTDPWNFDWSKL